MSLENTILKNRSTFKNVLPYSFNKNNIHILDLSKDNKELNNFNIDNTKEFADYINTKLTENKCKLAAGGYLEDRIIYLKSKHFGEGESTRTIHLGIDIWAKKYTDVLAPLDGKIHSFKNNNNYGDYGPAIILEHKLEGFTFYTLYGHLSLASLKNISENKKIKAGEKFAQLGNNKENGNWAPHLHFQIIKDMQDNYGDFPGVCYKNEVKKFRELCPDPNLILNIL